MEEEIPWETGTEIDSSWEEISEATQDWAVGMEVARVIRQGVTGEIIAPWGVIERGFIDHVSDTNEDRMNPYFVFLRDNWEGGPTPIAQTMEHARSWSDLTLWGANRWFRRIPVPAT